MRPRVALNLGKFALGLLVPLLGEVLGRRQRPDPKDEPEVAVALREIDRRLSTIERGQTEIVGFEEVRALREKVAQLEEATELCPGMEIPNETTGKTWHHACTTTRLVYHAGGGCKSSPTCPAEKRWGERNLGYPQSSKTLLS